MKILLLAGSYPPETGGIAQFMHSFAEGLAARGVDVEVAANFNLPAAGYLRRVSVCRSEVLRRTRGRAFDRLVASSWSPYAVAMPDVIFDVFCHGMDLLEPSHSLRYRVFMKRTLQRASRILANSAYTASLAKSLGARSDSVVILHPGVDCERFRPATTPTDSRTILSIGRLVQRKGFDTILRSLPRLIQLFPDIRYVCAGDGPEKDRLRELASELQVSAYVEWLGEVSEAEKVRLYQSAEIFVMPNRHDADGSVEGFGIVFLEAAACGLAVIGGHSGGVPDAIAPGETGYLVDPLNVDEVSTRITELLGDQQLRRKMGEQGRRRVMTNFRKEQIAERYLASF